MPLFPPFVDTTARFLLNASDRGFLAEVYPILMGAALQAPSVAGRLEISKIKLPAASVVTNIVSVVTTAGSTLTAGQNFVALYTGAGSLLAQSADQAAAWGSSGVKTAALAGGAQTLAAGFYYVGFWYNGTTAPTFVRTGNLSTLVGNAGFAAPNLVQATADTGLTTTAPPTMGAQTATAFAYWAALS